MIAMIAAKRFRYGTGEGFRWIDEGEEYDVPAESDAKFHEKTGRGKRKPKSRKGSE